VPLRALWLNPLPYVSPVLLAYVLPSPAYKAVLGGLVTCALLAILASYPILVLVACYHLAR
jgi:hypothetical protein